jgi:hypothetical protein
LKPSIIGALKLLDVGDDDMRFLEVSKVCGRAANFDRLGKWRV